MEVRKGEYFLYYDGRGNLSDLVMTEEDGIVDRQHGVRVISVKTFVEAFFSPVKVWKAFTPGAYHRISSEEAMILLMS